jgi:surface antigen
MRFPFRNSEQVVRYFKQHRVVSIVAAQFLVVVALVAVVLSSIFGSTLFGAFAQGICSSGDRVYSVVSGDTLGAIAGRYGTTWQKLASYNRIANANVIYINQHVCIPGGGSVASSGSTTSSSTSSTGWISSGVSAVSHVYSNVFAYPQCTWWAAQRYHQLHGIYPAWTSNANAWEWTARAYDFGWRVSSQPTVGAIVDLQPWVQGAYNFGHVGIVERIQSDGSALVSNSNWGASPFSISYSTIHPGYGVTFITN